MNRILSWALAVLGQALLITAFVLFRGPLPDDMLLLYIAVSSIIYWLCACGLIFPMVNMADRSGRGIGSLGVRWTVATVYGVAAITFLVIGYYNGWAFRLQAILQAGLALLLLVGLLLGRSAGSATAAVYQSEKFKQLGVSRMRAAVSELDEAVEETPELPAGVRDSIAALSADMRYISPNDDEQAQVLEARFTETVGDIRRALPSAMREPERVRMLLERAARRLDERRAYCS